MPDLKFILILTKMMFLTTSSFLPHFCVLFLLFTEKHYFVVTMEVLAEPRLEVTPEGFTKEVVKLEDGDLNQWPQLSVHIENMLMAAEKDGVVHVAVVYDATRVRLPLTPRSLTTVTHTTHRLLGSKVVAAVIRMCRSDSDMIHRLVTIGCGNGPRTTRTECWATHDISKNQWDSEPVDRPLCSYLQRKAAVKKPTTAQLYLRLTWKCEVGAPLGLKRLIWG